MIWKFVFDEYQESELSISSDLYDTEEIAKEAATGAYYDKRGPVERVEFRTVQNNLYLNDIIEIHGKRFVVKELKYDGRGVFDVTAYRYR